MFKVWSTFIQFFGEICAQTVDQQNVKPGRCRDATSRASTRHGRASVGLGVRATRRPRSPSPEARTSPCAAPRGSSESFRGLARRVEPRRTGPGLAADRRSIGGTPPYARRPRSPCYGGISRRHRDVTGGVAPIKTEPRPSSRRHRAPPCPPLPAAGELASPSFSSAPKPS
jgi:hypothetical protein